MAEKQSETFHLFSSLDNNPQSGFSFGFLDSTENHLPKPPPCFEVLRSQVSSSVKYTVEHVNLDGLALVKGRVSTEEVFALSNSDLVPGKYEGGLKLWEGSLDLVKTLLLEIQEGRLSFNGKKVLELGCGHGLPGIFASLESASLVHFQDFNAEVLQHLTMPNVDANLLEKCQSVINNAKQQAEVRFFAGDWSEVHQILPFVNAKEENNNRTAQLDPSEGYDIILMAETVYSVSALPNLYELLKKCIRRPDGVIYMAAKKYYFGVGGGSRRFLSIVEKDGTMAANLVNEVTDGSSNVREVWRFSIR